MIEDGPEVVAPSGENPITPSVRTRRSGNWIVGEAAVAQRLTAPGQTVYSVKRLMGRDVEELAEEIKELPYAVIPAQRKLVKVRIGTEEFTPQALSAEILREVKRRAEPALDQGDGDPGFDQPSCQQQLHRSLGALAGHESLDAVAEPSGSVAFDWHAGPDRARPRPGEAGDTPCPARLAPPHPRPRAPQPRFLSCMFIASYFSLR